MAEEESGVLMGGRAARVSGIPKYMHRLGSATPRQTVSEDLFQSCTRMLRGGSSRHSASNFGEAFRSLLGQPARQQWCDKENREQSRHHSTDDNTGQRLLRLRSNAVGDGGGKKT